MSRTISRAALLRGRWKREKTAPHPPWAADGATFHELCDGCGDCVTACPPGIVLRGPGGRPEVDFGRGACSLCGACATACPSGALADRGQAPWRHTAEIGPSCLSIQGIACRLCEEHCKPRAIRFRPVLGGRALPTIEAGACTACGACAHVCPAHAVTFQEAAAPKIAAQGTQGQEVARCPTA
jgi:ferredoxin-type protein NapF